MPDPQAPEQIEPQSLGDYLEVMSKAVFQSGMSWRVVESKWAGTREAFEGFDPQAVAAFGDRELDALAGDARVIRNRRKLQAVVNNAGRMIELEAEHGSFRDYLRSHGGFEATVADLRREFSFVGETGCYYLLYVVGDRCRRTTSGTRRGAPSSPGASASRLTAPSRPARRCASGSVSPSRSSRTAPRTPARQSAAGPRE